MKIVTPNPPSHVRVTLPQPDKSVHFEWNPPINESVGGIEGYKISYGENCGNCTPEAGFVNQTEELTADCSKYTEENTENNMCYFEVSTVSEDCSFDSLPVEATSGEYYYNYYVLHYYYYGWYYNYTVCVI